MKKLLIILIGIISFISFNKICLAMEEYYLSNITINLNLTEDDTVFFIDYHFKVEDTPGDRILIMNKYGTEITNSDATYEETSDSYVFKIEKGKEYNISYKVPYSHSVKIVLPDFVDSSGVRYKYGEYKITVDDQKEKLDYSRCSHDYRTDNTFDGEIEDISSQNINFVVNEIPEGEYDGEYDGDIMIFGTYLNTKYQLFVIGYAFGLVILHTLLRTICEHNEFNNFKFYFVLMLITIISVPALIIPYSLIILGIFYIPFFIMAFFTPKDKSSLFVKVFIVVHSIVLSGCILNPVAYLLAIYLINELGKFYLKKKGQI